MARLKREYSKKNKYVNNIYFYLFSYKCIPLCPSFGIVDFVKLTITDSFEAVIVPEVGDLSL